MSGIRTHNFSDDMQIAEIGINPTTTRSQKWQPPSLVIGSNLAS